MTADIGRAFVLSTGQRAAFCVGLRHEGGGVWGANITCAAVYAAEDVAKYRNGGLDAPNTV